jgi:hypothetical protein
MVTDMVTGKIWTPETDFVRDMYNLGRYVDGTKAETVADTTGGQGAREAEFNRWLRAEQRRVWAEAVDHLEAVLGTEMKRAAHADNPYGRWSAGDPCGVCGSTNTGWNSVEGGFCQDCGAADSDE